jgi:hypothetical protein
MQVYPSREQFAKDAGASALLSSLDNRNLRDLLSDGTLYKYASSAKSVGETLHLEKIKHL